MNIFRDNYAVVAAHVHRLLRNYKGRQFVVVRGDGGVAVMRMSQPNSHKQTDIIGYFTHEAPIEVVEDNLLARLRELQSA